ncbi:hypothetical protein HYU07_03350 [Candidatus Woesearchaeota archaeon]|nr:hypothetical protein [Candidatus Woesearchaeota archaeon]
MKPVIISETPMRISEVKEELKRIKKRDSELNFRAAKTEEYLEHYAGLGEEKSRELFDKISKLNIPRMKDAHICKIIDLMPKNAEDLKTVLQGYTITVKAENIKKISDIIKEFS